MFVSPKRNFVSFSCQPLCDHPQHLQLLVSTTVLQVCTDLPILDITYEWRPYNTWTFMSGFCQWMFLCFSCAIACVNTSVLFCNQTLFIALVYLVFCLSVHWQTLAYFHLTDAMDRNIQVSVWTCIFISLGRAGDSMLKCLKSFQVVLRSGSAPLHLPTGNIWRFWFFHILSNILPLPLFLKSHILVGEWYLTVVWSASP